MKDNGDKNEDDREKSDKWFLCSNKRRDCSCGTATRRLNYDDSAVIAFSLSTRENVPAFLSTARPIVGMTPRQFVARNSQTAFISSSSRD